MPGRDNGVPTRDRCGTDWYVIQVATGAEGKACDAIRRACAAHDAAAVDSRDSVGLQECFTPTFETQQKWKGEWRDVKRNLLPGYVIAVAERPDQLARALGTVGDFCRLLVSGETYTPLDERERLWFDEQTERGSRTVPMSFGYREGDRVVVAEGPLKGREGLITKVDRKNSLAFLEMHVGQMTIRMTVGLGIVPKNRIETE